MSVSERISKSITFGNGANVARLNVIAFVKLFLIINYLLLKIVYELFTINYRKSNK